MTSIEEALDNLNEESQETQRIILEAEDAHAYALVLLNLFTIHASAVLMLAGAIETFGNDKTREISNKVAAIVETHVDELNKRVDIFTFLNEVPAAADLLAELEDLDDDSDANG